MDSKKLLGEYQIAIESNNLEMVPNGTHCGSGFGKTTIIFIFNMNLIDNIYAIMVSYKNIIVYSSWHILT